MRNLFCTTVTSDSSPTPRLFYSKQRTVTRGRRKIWVPRAITQADIERGRGIMQEWGPDCHTRYRVVGDFELMCKLSALLTSDPLAAVGFLGQLANSGLGPGSIDTYTGYVCKRYRSLTNVQKAAAARHADFDAKHAADISDDTLWTYVEEASPKYRAILWILFISGLRSRAIRFLRRRRIFIPEKWGSADMEFVVKIDKTRKRRALTAILSLPKAWKWLRPPPHAETLSFLQHGDQEERLFDDFKATDINAELSAISKRLDLPRPTTYSFRRAFINRIVPLVGKKSEMTKFTLHFQQSTVDAFYRRTQDDKNKIKK